MTIPRLIRERLGLRAGAVLEFETDADGRLIATRAPARNPVDEVDGILALDRPTDEIMRELRGDREELL